MLCFVVVVVPVRNNEANKRKINEEIDQYQKIQTLAKK